MISIKTKEEIEVLREGGKLLASIISILVNKVELGINAEDLNNLAIKLARESGGELSFLNYKPSGRGESYPSALCVSVNNEVVHGLPFAKILKEGDIVGLDLGMKYKNLYTDMAVTVGIGNVDEKSKKLIEVAKKSLDKGISVIKEGAKIGDIGETIQNFVEGEGLSVVKKLVGHGVGYAVHESPEIPNFGKRGRGLTLKEGMVLALEPMVNLGNDDVTLSSDKWTWVTVDGSLSAHFEHTIVVTKEGVEILTKCG